MSDHAIGLMVGLTRRHISYRRVVQCNFCGSKTEIAYVYFSDAVENYDRDSNVPCGCCGMTMMIDREFVEPPNDWQTRFLRLLWS